MFAAVRAGNPSKEAPQGPYEVVSWMIPALRRSSNL
jgi:hypothetical protein